jgi:hypothetical protein
MLSPDFTNLTIVSATTSKDFSSVVKLIDNIRLFEPIAHIVIYNLGLSPDELAKLSKKKVTIEHFEFSLYPNFVQINEINETDFEAWKPIILYDISQMKYSITKFVLWCSPTVLIQKPLSDIKNILLNCGLYSPIDIRFTLEKSTYPSTFQMLSLPQPFFSLPSRNSDVIGINTNILWIDAFLQHFKQLCLIKECIAPIGSNKSNHHFASSIFNCLYYMYSAKYKLTIVNDTPGIKLS